MQIDTPFYKSGRDVFWKSTGVYWSFWGITLVYTILLFALWTTTMNVQVPHTYFLNAGSPGLLFSLRYTSLQWTAFMLMGTRIFLIAALLTMVAFRDDYRCNTFWYVIAIVIFLIQLFSFSALSHFYVTCNRDGDRWNPCNDEFYCCEPTRNANPDNFCNNPVPCSAPVPPGFSAQDLRPRKWFIDIYWVNFALFLLDIAWLVWLGILWFTRADFYTFQENDKEKVDMQDDTIETYMTQPTSKNRVQLMQSHTRLRKR